MSKTILLVGGLVASLVLAYPLVVWADSGQEDKAHSATEEGHSGGHGGATLAPASLAGAWTALMAARDAIAEDVESGALGNVHAKAGPLAKLVAALLEHSEDLDAGKRTRVEGAAKQVTRVADALHVAADRGDAARTRKELSRLDGLLQLIRAQYPAAALDAGSHGHESHSAAPGDGLRSIARAAGKLYAAGSDGARQLRDFDGKRLPEAERTIQPRGSLRAHAPSRRQEAR